MELISAERRAELTANARDLRKVELRDDYGMDAALLEAWRTGDLEEIDRSAREYAAEIVTMRANGWNFRRVRVVSEPLSEYQRMAVATCSPSVDAGEDLRWLPRRLLSAVALPGNDWFVVDGKAVIFNILDGDNQRAEIQYSEEADVLKLCREAFNTAWTLAIPHNEYKAS